jgi:thiol-disulfide isomerase/thioredoxin
VEPKLDDRKLVIAVTLPEPDLKKLGDLTGKVVDNSGHPIAGASVALITIEHGGSGIRNDNVLTDAHGSFRLRSIPSAGINGGPITIQLAVTKEGYAGIDTPKVLFQPGVGSTTQVAETVTLSRGESVDGVVVDPSGKPLAGVWVEPGGSYANRSQFTKSDDAGRFAVRDLPNGMVSLNFRFGKLTGYGKYLATTGTDPVTVTLRPVLAPAASQARSDAVKAAQDRAKPPALGTSAPEWESGHWSDGQARKLADYRGKIVVLTFWGTWCAPCVSELPSLDKLRAKYEPRGLIFLTLHTPGETEKNVRKVLDLKTASLLFAIDGDRKRDAEFDRSGVTAQRYGVIGYPTFVIIDRQGNIAFHSGVDTAENVAAMKALGKTMGLNEATMSESDLYRLWEAYFSREIEKVMNRP